MILLIDNYDSFTYNLYQYIGEINPDIVVKRNDALTVEQIEEMKPSHIVISPGPGYPKDAGISTDVIRRLGSKIPILGVCLGHQAIGEAYGGKIVHAKKLMHGKVSEIEVINSCKLFKGLESKIKAGRYHSLVIQKESMPSELVTAAVSAENEIMAVKHKNYPVFGIQFHPESIMTGDGKKILKNFLDVS